MNYRDTASKSRDRKSRGLPSKHVLGPSVGYRQKYLQRFQSMWVLNAIDSTSYRISSVKSLCDGISGVNSHYDFY